MSGNIIMCDGCEKVESKREVHGWFSVSVYITKPTQEQWEAANDTPEGRMTIEAAGIKPAEQPAIIGGDFCCMECLIKYYSEQKSVKDTMEAPPLDPRSAGEVGDAPPPPKPFGWDDNSGYM